MNKFVVKWKVGRLEATSNERMRRIPTMDGTNPANCGADPRSQLGKLVFYH